MAFPVLYQTLHFSPLSHNLIARPFPSKFRSRELRNRRALSPFDQISQRFLFAASSSRFRCMPSFQDYTVVNTTVKILPVVSYSISQGSDQSGSFTTLSFRMGSGTEKLQMDFSNIPEERFEVTNKQGEKLVGVLHNTGSKKVVVICHGFRSSKDSNTMVNLAAALTKQGISTFRFDFSGNGESEGQFEYGNYRKEVEDLHSVVSYLSQKNFDVLAIVGHSKGGNVVLLYATMYDDVKMVLNLSGRFDLRTGVKERLGQEFMQTIEKDGFIDVEDRKGGYRVTKDSLMGRLNTDMAEEVRKIKEECRVLTIHGAEDNIVPVQDAREFAKVIPNHKLHIINGADHGYTAHQAELASAVLDFITSS